MQLQALRKIAVPFLLILLVSACSAAEKPATPITTPEIIPTVEPTATLAPTLIPTPVFIQDWTGSWFLWVGDYNKRIEANFSIEDNQITSTIQEVGETRKINAVISSDGITAAGTWESSSGDSGLIDMLISEDRQEFVGNLDSEAKFCGSRAGHRKPSYCLTTIDGGWSGEWVVWFGPEEVEAILFFKQEGSEINVMVYDFEGTVSEDRRTLIGEFNELGISGSLEAKILDNRAQFTGNMLKLFPFCGVRNGGPKPTDCLGP